MRLVLQRGEPGLNPKVNQLITLCARARHELLVVSDSNVKVRREYLRDIAAYLEDPRVGLVTHPIAGAGEQTLGALFDNAHLSAGIAPGTVAANELASFPIVIGKSMALRRADLRALGGFASVKDVLAEDFVLGRRVPAELGKDVAVAHRPITAVSRARSLRGFLDRYVRWGTIQRRSVGPTRYVGMLLLHPLPAASCALLLAPSAETGSAFAACWLAKALLEHRAALGLRGSGFALPGLLLLPVKDALLLFAWVLGLARNSVEWRGNRLTVLDGTRLVPIPAGRTRRWRTVPSATLLFATRLFR
jgi:ceramide glucosyltransferase